MEDRNVPDGYGSWGKFMEEASKAYTRSRELRDQGENSKALTVELLADGMFRRYNQALIRGDVG